MVARPWLAVFSLVALFSLGAQSRTKNFTVEAPTQALAERVGQWAEYYRKQKAMQWLGQEMPQWPQPCPLRVKVSMNGSGGATSFVFDRGRILSMTMEIEGTVDRLIASVLPHEVTHTVLAHRFKQPVPRWADEGGSVLSEDEQERTRHDQLVRQILNTQGRMIPLERLFRLTQYPRDVMVLYAEGYSVTNFLIGRSNRAEFLNFIGDGMQRGWDVAVKTHYGFPSVNELERAWLESLKKPHQLAGEATLARTDDQEKAAPEASRVSSRQTWAVPTLGAPRPVARGVSPEANDAPRPIPPKTNASFPANVPPPPAARLGAPQKGWDNRQ